MPQINLADTLIASLFVLISALISFIFRLNIEKIFILAGVRACLQLGVLGLFLKGIFTSNSPTLTFVYMLMMTLVASFTIYSRAPHKHKNLLKDSFCSSFLSTWIFILLPSQIFMQPNPWYNPQFFIPLLGMLLGNSLNGITLAQNSISHAFISEKQKIEELLSFGASKWEASREVFQEAIKVGTLPITNAMLVSGLVSLPGMMTGQILAGVSPLEAVKYQIFILYLIAGASLFGNLLMIYFYFKRHFNDMHQLIDHHSKAKIET